MSAAFAERQFPLLAKCPAGLESILASELIALGALDVEPMYRAVAFTGNKRLLYAANYHCRTALRILLPIHRFSIRTEDDLYRLVKNIRWEEYFSPSDTFAIDSTVNSSVFSHSHFVSLRTKDAIADRFRERTGNRPSVNIEDPGFRINVHLSNNEVNISFDSSGSSLHKRGYHVSNAEAPLSEVLAAGMILLAGWDGQTNFTDVMCGSGTLLTEAAMIAMNLPAGQFRESYGFMRWKDYDPSLWDQILEDALSEQRDLNVIIRGSDISENNLRSAMANLKQARLHKDVELRVAPFTEAIPPPAPGTLITNPPYGERIPVNDINRLYSELGSTLKHKYQGYKAWIISADHHALKMTGLKPMKKYTLFNGQLECHYAGFELFAGKRKEFLEEKS